MWCLLKFDFEKKKTTESKIIMLEFEYLKVH
jgi:hypothetical protein